MAENQWEGTLLDMMNGGIEALIRHCGHILHNYVSRGCGLVLGNMGVRDREVTLISQMTGIQLGSQPFPGGGQAQHVLEALETLPAQREERHSSRVTR